MISYTNIMNLSNFTFLSKFTNKNPNIAVIKLTGVIGSKSGPVVGGGISLASLNKSIEDAFKIPRLAAVCLCINSPGGSPVQSELIALRIRKLASEKNIPIFSFIEDIGASGGYWLACIGDEIYASKSSIIGSIGVIYSGFGFDELIEKIGIKRRLYTSGNNKSILDPFSPEKQEDVEIIEKVQKMIHNHFIDYVKERRAGKITQEDDIIYNGMFWSGEIALDYGLIDGIEDMYSFIEKKYGKDVNIKHIEQKTGWLKRRFGITLTVDPSIMDIFRSGIK